MTEAAAAPEAKKGGSAIKTVLIVIIVILLLGVAGGVYFMMPEKIPELKSYQWPPEGEPGLKVSATLSDGSAILMTEIRLETVPVDLVKHGVSIAKEFSEKKSVIENFLTEAGMSLTSESALTPCEFRQVLRKKINDELTMSEIERILIKDWLVAPAD
jgi:flagellar basal body-associated protein FliL